MALDLQKLTIRRLLDNPSSDLYSKLSSEFFEGANLLLFNKIKTFYKSNVRLPNLDEFSVLKKDDGLQDYFEHEILSEENKYDSVANEFLVGQLQDYYVRETTVAFLENYIDELPYLEKVEIIDKLQNHVLTLNDALPTSEELYDIGDLNFIPSADDFQLYPSGISSDYDSVNGGFALQELVLLGGRRGSGKSIISLNLAFKRFLSGSTISFFTIEMRYKEVYDRLLSIMSGVPFLDLFKNQVTEEQKLTLIKSKFNYFYEKSSLAEELYKKVFSTRDFVNFEKEVREKKPKLLDNRFLIIDDESLSLSRLEHYNNTFKHTYPNYNMSVVDYLNIMSIEDSMNWKSQITLANGLKSNARKYDLTAVSPYQIDDTGEARFAKGILDSADRSFIFFPAKEGDNRVQENKIEIHTSKIRNGKHMSFEVPMDWECVRIQSSQSGLINSKPHKAALYSSDKNEVAREL